MTKEEREEAIRCLSVHSSTNGSGLCTDEQHYEAKKIAIQALSQEPTYFPPCIDCNKKMDEIRRAYDKLNKIRAEVEQIDAPKDYPYNMVTECVKAEVLQIINKYR